MLATVHALVGAVIASKVTDPVSGTFLIVSSHFIMDCIPHWDFGTHWRKRPKYITGIIAIADTVIGITVAYLLFRGKGANNLYLLFGIVLSVFPDWLETPWHIFFAKAKEQHQELRKNANLGEQLAFGIYKLESLFHARAQFPFGFITQLVTLAFFFLLLR